MARQKLTGLARYLHQIAASQKGNCLTDTELVERYVRYRDEAAFELLLWRHGTLVLNVCRRFLLREEDAEDAFQATFLTFVRKAPAIAHRGSVASWLYKVAYRVALEAKSRQKKIAGRERSVDETLAVQQPSDPTWEERRPILDEELTRLPERLRRPFILCYLEGKTNEEAAQEIGCPAGTVFSRLSRGREMLRNRLVRRGVTLSATVLTERVADAVPAASLVKTTLRAALLFAEGGAAGGSISTQATTLAEGVLRTMFITKIKMAALLVLVASVLIGGVLTHRLAAFPPPEASADEPSAKRETPRKAEAEPIAVKVVKPKPSGLPMRVGGRAEVVAAQQQRVVPLISGTVKEVTVAIGDRVKKGQVLISLDAPLLATEIQQAAASLEMAEARVQEAKAAVNTVQAEFQTGGPQIRRSKIDHAQAALKAAEANVKMSRAILDKARIQLSFTQLTAAFDGVVMKRTADPGNFVQPSDSRLLEPLLTVQRIDMVRVVARVGGIFAPHLERGRPVKLQIAGVHLTEKVARFIPAIDGSDRGTTVEMDVSNADHRLWPGMEGQVKIQLKKTNPNGLLVPLTCLSDPLLMTDEDPFVYVVRDGKAHKLRVNVTKEDGKNAEISEDIKASHLIIVPFPTKLNFRDGVPVKIEKMP